MGKKSYKHPRQYTTETFKERLKEVYGDKFGIDFVEYNGAYEDVNLKLERVQQHVVRQNAQNVLRYIGLLFKEYRLKK